jgi:hypothetical protein
MALLRVFLFAVGVDYYILFAPTSYRIEALRPETQENDPLDCPIKLPPLTVIFPVVFTVQFPNVGVKQVPVTENGIVFPLINAG